MLFFRLIALMSLGFLVACGAAPMASPTANPAAGVPSGTTDAPPVLSPTVAEVVARVNGAAISRTAYQTALARALRGSQATDALSLGQQVLESLIEQELVRQAAAAQNISVSDAEAQAELDALKANLPADTSWSAFLTLNGYTEAQLLEAQRDALLTQRLRDALMADLLGDVLQVRARHILVATEAEANALLEALRGGTDFATLANDRSLDQGSRGNGGDLGWFTAEELSAPRLAEVAFALDVGSVAGPVVTDLGYHVIQTLEKATRPIEPERLGALMQGRYLLWLQAQYQQATIERYLT